MKPIPNTVFGGLGFIGSHLCRDFDKDGLSYQIVSRKDPVPFGNLGNIYYCAGITADFRSRPFDTIDAHISTLSNILEHGQYSNLLYLSSARIYRHATLTAEDTKFLINPFDPENLVDISKLAGEALCLSINDARVRVVRLSNVFGENYSSENFLTHLIESALIRGTIHLRSSLESSKDYIDVESVVRLIRSISEFGRDRIYNIASGYNVTHGEIVHLLKSLTGCSVTVDQGASAIKWPLVNIERIIQEFGFKPLYLMDELEGLVKKYKNFYLR
jgi:nucleoside-diphosphate-sugar epimerase